MLSQEYKVTALDIDVTKVEKINNDQQITFFEILTACYFYKAAKYPNNINLIEAGLFHRFDATNMLKSNLASIVCSISKDHLDWLPKNEQTIEKIVFEKTSTLLNSNIIVAKQSTKETMDYIKKTISQNKSNKLFFNDDFSYSINENNFFYYEDKLGGLKLPMPNVLGQYQLENISTAIATLRTLDLEISDEHIKKGITNIELKGRLQELQTGKLKNISGKNRLIIDGGHNESSSISISNWIKQQNQDVHLICGMMKDKEHYEFMKHFKDVVKSITLIDIPNQVGSISKEKFKDKLNALKMEINLSQSIEEAVKLNSKYQETICLFAGSLYMVGEVLNLN